ncbi:putative signal recognition particle subunit SRP68 [Medicago truncatula]|uniref:Signal recognition particle subunit SRP68 n=1 Tax=Medicago truncatula TaxID=3880 RepID=G7LIT8_MEDTR|nr:signal recognition particle subunit SRP68 [Medicago truncatula]AET05066.1 signal recognition particle 68 kDa protein [Medicago truncatula]RHN43250.1 putative signal recognition particle subunit SRP68 [Medicago truncatula]
MGKENQSSAMEVDDPKSTNSDQIVPKFSITVLQLLKSAQMQHGLRHGDYTRYRRYCTARLRRLYKSLKFTHGRGKYTKRTLTESNVTEVRFLHVILYSAERAWSHAMEKRQLPNGPNASQRIYLIGRLRKAVKWATLFSQFCAVKADSRTSLEAEAYESYMKGSLLFEQDQNWDVALKHFKSARAVYEELGKYGDLDNQVLCRERVEELEPSIRYCLHKIGQSNLQASELLNIGDMEGPALDLFKAKLEAAMAEARSQQAASMTEFHWLGHRFPISNAKTRVAILKAQELEKDIHGPLAENISADKRLVTFDKIFSAYHDARGCIRADLATAGNAESVKDDLNGLDKAVSAVLGERTIERNLLLVKVAKSKLAKRNDDKNEKLTKPEELVRLYDLLLQNTSDLSDLVSSGRDQKPEEVSFAEECSCKSLAFRAERCFYVAKSYSVAGKRAEAYALYCRARSLAEDALGKLQKLEGNSKTMVKELEVLCNECRSNSCIEHALGIMEEKRTQENISEGISNISLTGAERLEKFLLEKLDVYESAVGDSNVKSAPRIAPFPPAFQAIARNPIVLDLAYNTIEFPDIQSRMKKDKRAKGGFISRIFG